MRTPILLVGPPGVGKTAKIRASYDHCEVLLLSSQTEEDIAGIPYRDGVNEKRTVPPFIQRLTNAKGTKCLFLDEIDKARREVADTLLTLITHPQQFGVPDDVDIVAAANPPEWGGGDGVSMPMMNRFAIVNFVPDIMEWTAYMRKKHGDNKFVEGVISSVKSREIPILECLGEGFEWRMTSPRSLDMAVGACLNEPEAATDIVKGLLTANAASRMLMLFEQFKTKEKGGNSEKKYSAERKITRVIGSLKLNNIYVKELNG